jgi:hypothetical protein
MTPKGEPKRRREPQHEPEVERKNGHVATFATTEVEELIVDRVAHERENAPPRFGMISATHLQRLALEGDAAAAKGRRAFAEWMDGLNGDETAAVTVKMAIRWKEIVRGLKPRGPQ